MNLKKIFKPLLTVCLAMVTAIGFTGCGEDNAKTQLNIATGGVAGTYYPIGGAIAEVITAEVPNITANAQATGASVANIDMLKNGSVDMAIVQNDVAYYAITGTNMFDKKIDNLRGVASLYSEACQFVTLADSGIESIYDLRGKRVVVGTAGSGGEANARQILKAYGLTYDDIEESYFSFADGAKALKNGQADAICIVAGYPTASIQDIAEDKDIRIISFDEDIITKLIIEYPFFTQIKIPAGVYKGFDEEVLTIGVNAIIVTNDKLNDKLGYEITQAIFNHTDKIQEAHPAAKTIDKRFARVGMGFIEMNSGAERFLEE